MSMLVGLMPQAAYASETEQNTSTESRQSRTAGTSKSIFSLGTEGMVSPEIPQKNTDDWKGSYVWYGKYAADDDSEKEAVRYRVLAPKTTDFSTGNTLLLDCDNVLVNWSFNSTESNVWATSELRTNLNGSKFLEAEGVFTSVEKLAIIESQKSSVSVSDRADGDSGLSLCLITVVE